MVEVPTGVDKEPLGGLRGVKVGSGSKGLVVMECPERVWDELESEVVGRLKVRNVGFPGYLSWTKRVPSNG